MAKKIKQFRFYGEGNDNNGNLKLSDYNNGNAFSKVYPITQLGIQGPPGTRFYLNGSVNPIVIGASGIYDLDIKNGARVTGLEFDEESLRRVTPNNILIVDILYGEEG